MSYVRRTLATASLALAVAVPATVLDLAPAAAQSSRPDVFRRSDTYLKPRIRPTDFYRAQQNYLSAPRTRPQEQKEAKRTPSRSELEPDKRPAGQLHIVISIPDQRLSLYANGAKIATAPVSTGQKGYATPMGLFSIIQKARFHRSNIYSGAPMPFMQRITWSGVALHAGHLPGYPASHGCIRLPGDFAQRLFAMTKLGARVIITTSDIAPQDIEHATLTALKAKVGDPVRAPVAVRGLEKAPRDAADEKAPAPILVSQLPSEIRQVDASAPASAVEPPVEPAPPQLEPPVLKPDPIAILVSRKLGRIYVRQGFAPLFDGPVTFKEPEAPIGTHVFTAMEPIENATRMRWTAITLPGETIAQAEERARVRKPRRGEAVAPVEPARVTRVSVTALEALNRVEIPPEVLEELAEFMREGSSLIITDHGFGPETGKGTDFIVVTR